MAWVLDHQRDLMADFRAIYHLGWEEALALPGPEFLALAHRVSAYQGVMAARLATAEAKERRGRPPRGTHMVEGSREAVQSDSLLAGAVSFS